MRASRPCSENAFRISAAARTARSASSSCTTGIPENGHDGIADEFLDRPLLPLDDSAQFVEVTAHPSPERLRIRRLPEEVESTTSAKRTVTIFRTSRADGASSGEPHALQKRASSGFSRPQLGQAATCGVYERAGCSSASSISAERVAARCGSKRPAPSSSTAAEPAATASRTA